MEKKKHRRNLNFGWFGAAAGSGIFQIIRKESPISRAKIVTLTGLSKSTVSLHVERLIKIGLVKEEIPPGSGGGNGNKRTLLKVDADAGYVIGVDLGVTSLDVGLCNLDADILDTRSEELSIAQGPEFVLERVDAFIADLVESNNVSINSIFGIGVGLPGTVEFETGISVCPPAMPGWDRYPVRDKIAEKFGCTVFVDNDVNVMAVGAKLAGLGKTIENFIFVKVGTGIGAGIIIDGHLYRGPNGSAGDIGHIPTGNEEGICFCGNQGCLELVASGAAMARLGKNLAESGKSALLKRILDEKGEISALDVGLTADQGDLPSLEVIRHGGKEVGKVLAKVVNFFNPTLIIIGGGVSKLGEKFLSSIREGIYSHSMPVATSDLIVKPSSLGEKSGMIGAAAMVLEEVFSHGSITEMVDQFPTTTA